MSSSTHLRVTFTRLIFLVAVLDVYTIRIFGDSTNSEANADTFSTAYDYDYDGEFIHDQDTLEQHLGGALTGRKFITVQKLKRAGKEVERPYHFRTKREKVKDRINETMARNLTHVPEEFNSSTTYVRYTHQLSVLERLETTPAKPGDPCRSTTLLEADYCERAGYPNKGKMVCNTVNDPRMMLTNNVCICKYFRLGEKEARFKQMTMHKVNFHGVILDACLSPRNGECNHRISTGITDTLGRLIFEVDVCLGHYQCDNTNYWGDTVIPEVKRHCSESTFLRNFNASYRNDVLICSKPHPRRFADYDEYKFYCLPKIARNPDQKNFKRPQSEDSDGDYQDDNVIIDPRALER